MQTSCQNLSGQVAAMAFLLCVKMSLLVIVTFYGCLANQSPIEKLESSLKTTFNNEDEKILEESFQAETQLAEQLKSRIHSLDHNLGCDSSIEKDIK